MKLMPIAVLNAMFGANLSLPQRSRAVSRAIEVLRPDVTKIHISIYETTVVASLTRLVRCLLDKAMIVPIPNSGAYVCNVHSAEKSPTVHPTRHRSVLIPALFHVPRQFQKAHSDSNSLGFLRGLATTLLLCNMLFCCET
jgi:hypothetical protein